MKQKVTITRVERSEMRIAASMAQHHHSMTQAYADELLELAQKADAELGRDAEDLVNDVAFGDCSLDWLLEKLGFEVER